MASTACGWRSRSVWWAQVQVGNEHHAVGATHRDLRVRGGGRERRYGQLHLQLGEKGALAQRLELLGVAQVLGVEQHP